MEEQFAYFPKSALRPCPLISQPDSSGVVHDLLTLYEIFAVNLFSQDGQCRCFFSDKENDELDTKISIAGRMIPRQHPYSRCIVQTAGIIHSVILSCVCLIFFSRNFVLIILLFSILSLSCFPFNGINLKTCPYDIPHSFHRIMIRLNMRIGFHLWHKAKMRLYSCLLVICQ